MSVKKTIAKILKRVLPLKVYKLIANGFIIVPKYYSDLITDYEEYMSYTLEDSKEKDMLLMRKHAHIIDKGLHRADIAPGHSSEHAKELRTLIERLESTDFKSDPSFIWAKEKLSIYEQVQKNETQLSPLGEPVPAKPAISFDNIVSLIKQRRSNRYFEEKIIETDIIDKLRDIANYAPSSCNKQPINIFYTNDPSLSLKCLRCCAGGTGFGSYIPVFMALTADVRGYILPMEFSLPYIDVSLGLQNLLIAAQTLGISGCVLTWSQKNDQDDSTLRQLLNIPKSHIIVANLVLGYPSKQYITPTRKGL